MRPQILQLAHEGHQNISKVAPKANIVWWPGIDFQGERYVHDCLGCQIIEPKTPQESLQITAPPRQV